MLQESNFTTPCIILVVVFSKSYDGVIKHIVPINKPMIKFKSTVFLIALKAGYAVKEFNIIMVYLPFKNLR